VARFLRAIRQRRWFTYPDIDWLPQGELQADALLDLRTVGNSISLYEIRDDSDELRIATALAANRDNVDVIDYAVFEDSQFTELDLAVSQSVGETPDATVNSLHYDLLNLTARQVGGLAEVISNGAHTRIPRKTVSSLLAEAIEVERLDRERIKLSLLSRLQ
jgi:hypothetical protein